MLVLHCLLLSRRRRVTLRMWRQSELLMLLLLYLLLLVEVVVVVGGLLVLPLALLLHLGVRNGRRDHGLLLHRIVACLRHLRLAIWR